MKTLNTVSLNSEVIIKSFNNDFIQEKLMEMGCLIGDKVKVLKRAPLGGPLFVQIGYSQLGLRLTEAEAIEIE